VKSRATSSAVADLPLFSFRGLPIAFGLAWLLCWPIWTTGASFTFFDTNSYFTGGQAIWNIVDGVYSQVFPNGDTAASGGEQPLGQVQVQDEEGPRFSRSLFYPVVDYPLISLAGPLGIAIFQGTFALFSVFALIDRAALRSPRILLGGGVACIALSTLPWHTVFMMPDVLSATILVFAAVIVTTFAGMSFLQKMTITLMAAFAAGTHYGNMPLTLGLALVTALIAAYEARLTLLSASALVMVVATAPVANMAASRVFSNEASPAPLRLPILLARSLEDGLAVRYLEETCPESGYAMCTAFGGRIPDGIESLLWASDGIESLDAETMARIRREEMPLVRDVFLAYPFQQSAIFLWNSLRQLTAAGTGQIYPRTAWDWDNSEIDKGGQALLDVFDRITPIFTLLAALFLAALAMTGRLSRRNALQLVVFILGILVNALIFGGLSSPADRYQSRLIWLLPALATIAFATFAGARKSRGASDDRGLSG